METAQAHQEDQRHLAVQEDQEGPEAQAGPEVQEVLLSPMAVAQAWLAGLSSSSPGGGHKAPVKIKPVALPLQEASAWSSPEAAGRPPTRRCPAQTTLHKARGSRVCLPAQAVQSLLQAAG